jgi:hypothetical protein
MILVAGTLGFILGSRAGREPYERLANALTNIRRRPEVSGVVDSVQDEANRRADELSGEVQSKVGSSTKVGA